MQLSNDNETNGHRNTTMKANTILALIANGNTKAYKPTKKRDTLDNLLGTLSEEMKKLWCSISELSVPFEKALEAFSDRVAIYEGDIKHHGDRMEQAMIDNHANTIKESLGKVNELRGPYAILHNLFTDLLNEEYGEVAKARDKPTLGIRAGFEVVCRSQDNRGDTETLIDRYKPELEKFCACCGKPKSTAKVITVLIAVPRPDTADESTTEETAAEASAN